MNPLSSEQKDLVQDHLPLARKIARSMAKKYFKIPEDVLFSQACLGLINAASRFEAEKGSFEAYASICIRGAIKDYPRENRIVSMGADRKTYPKQVFNLVSKDNGGPVREQNAVEALSDGNAAAEQTEDCWDAKTARKLLVRLFSKQPPLVKALLINYFMKGWPLRLAVEGKITEARGSQLVTAFCKKKSSTDRRSIESGRVFCAQKSRLLSSGRKNRSTIRETRRALRREIGNTMRSTERKL